MSDIYSKIQLFLIAENRNDEWLYLDKQSVDRGHKSLMISGLLMLSCIGHFTCYLQWHT